MLLGAAALLLPSLGAAPLERAEVYFVDAARAMVESGDYLVPRYRGEPFFDKPALTYWLIAGSFRAFGFTTAAARLVPALAAVLVLLATAWLGRLVSDHRAALAGCVVLATTPAFMVFGRIAMSDMLLTLWSTLAVALALALFRSARPERLLVALAAALGLGFLTKGPVAVLLPGLGIAALAWSRRRELPRIGSAWLALAVAVFALLGLGWFALVWLRLGSEPLRYFFLRENLARFAGGTYDSGRAPWYYLVTYLAEGLPWSLLLPLSAWAAAREGGGGRLLLVWAGLMAVPLSLSRGKIDYYLLPLYPALSLVIGRHLTRERWGAADRAWARVALLPSAVGLALLPLLAGRVPAEWLPAPGMLAALAVVAGAGALACALAAARPAPTRTLATLSAVTAALFVAAAALLLPVFAAAQPHRAVVQDVLRERRYRPDAELVVCHDAARVHREVLFHARLAVKEQCDLWAPASSRHPFLLLLLRGERESLAQLPGLREVATYRFLPATVLTLDGLRERTAPDELSLMANYATEDPVAETKRKRERKRALRAVAASAQ